MMKIWPLLFFLWNCSSKVMETKGSSLFFYPPGFDLPKKFGTQCKTNKANDYVGSLGFDLTNEFGDEEFRLLINKNKKKLVLFWWINSTSVEEVIEKYPFEFHSKIHLKTIPYQNTYALGVYQCDQVIHYFYWDSKRKKLIKSLKL